MVQSMVPHFPNHLPRPAFHRPTLLLAALRRRRRHVYVRRRPRLCYDDGVRFHLPRAYVNVNSRWRLGELMMYNEEVSQLRSDFVGDLTATILLPQISTKYCVNAMPGLEELCSPKYTNNFSHFVGLVVNKLDEFWGKWEILSELSEEHDNDNSDFKFRMFVDAFTSIFLPLVRLEKVEVMIIVFLHLFICWFPFHISYGHNLTTSTYIGETSSFCISLCIFGLILFSQLIGNMQQ
ncbi:cyclic nucleotide-gated channel 18, partial [Striga asiatica]